MLDRIHTSKPLIGAPPPEGFGRDPRIDACRGIALWWIFLDHVPNNVGCWLTLRNYGFSDAAEMFMFISGVTCALAYGKACRCEGWSGVIRRSLRRGWDIYAAFLLLTLACAIVVYLAGGGHLADESNTRLLLEHPGSALAHAAILQYRPVNTDILPTFVVFHVLFAPLLWLLLRAPNVTLGASLLLYALVHVFGWTVPAWPNNVWYFNPLAWQLLIVLGAWWVIEGERLRPWGDLAYANGTCRSLSGFQPNHHIELEHQVSGTAGPANSDKSAFPSGQIESQSITTAASSCS